ncbi:MAG: DNA polymerase IV [Candidatus Marsarchaeota archaeon]|nr:DNA polymerase IV [Candidatus Marsarchaeota archaeon]MCL5114998.1 DNA polymerase IV [Candidatus Marsarchaeota archaeon]
MKLILYVDMDCFFAACEEARHPELRGKPLITGTSPEETKLRGVVESANYEARKFGIHSAMPTSMAYKLKPDIIYMHSDEQYYENVSRHIMKALSNYGYRMEVDSVDEAALEIDVEDCAAAEKLAKEIKEKIKRQFNLPCTVGVSSGKIYAKMACDSAKPDGIMIVGKKDVGAFLKDKGVGKIPGVGRKTEEKLAAMGIKTIGDLSNTGPMALINAVGSFGKELFLIANGTDESGVEESSGAMSIGRERTLDKNAKEVVDIEETLDALAGEVIAEVKRQDLRFKNVGVKARYFDFTDRVKSRSLTGYSDSKEVILSNAKSLFKELFGDKPVRKIGVRVSSLISTRGQRRLV